MHILHSGELWAFSVLITQIVNIVPNRSFFSSHPLQPFVVTSVYYSTLYVHVYPLFIFHLWYLIFHF